MTTTQYEQAASDAADAYVAAFKLIEAETHDPHNAHFAAMRAMELAVIQK